MLSASIEIRGMEEAQRMLRRDLRPAMRAASLALAEQVRGKVAVYPAQRASADPNRWYQRGYGPRWRRKDGSVGGRKTSEQLGQKWATEAKGDGAVVGTTVSYAPWVQSAEHQAAVHQATGWVTDEQAVRAVEQSGVVEQIVGDAVVHEMTLP